jgi:hypothetical protein
MAEPQISRKQAWCKLAVLIAEGLPEPTSISFNENSVSVVVDGIEAFNAWQSALNLRIVHEPILSNAGDVWIHDAWNYWHGWHARAHTTMPAVDSEPVGLDMSAVKALAEPTCVCCTNDCGDRRGHVLDERQFVTPQVCVCGDVWPCEKAAAS